MAAAATPNILSPRTRVLVASADSGFRKRLMTDPLYAGAWREEVCGGAHALTRLGEIRCDSVLLDRHLPDLDAGEVAEYIRKLYPLVSVEFVDSHRVDLEAQDAELREEYVAEEMPELCAADMAAAEITRVEIGTGWGARRVAGATATAVSPTAISAGARAERRLVLREEAPFDGMVGESIAMQQVYALGRIVAPRDTSVLIMGETGTGKELVAQGIHALSARAKQPCVVVNCAAIPDALLESELFGYARGAFTGAVQSRLGRIHMAQGGTLFLDEVGDLPLSMQAKLLRFLQNGEVQRLGSSEVYRVDVRVVCATNVSLAAMVEARKFRQDLYYRLAVFPIVMPPLRMRSGDIPALVRHFLARFSADVSVEERTVSAEALAWMTRERWPGNVRELQHAVERAFILAGNETELQLEHFKSFLELSGEMSEYQRA
jgi:transcriptional regulator of aromatic amino acid metabolism